MADTLVQLTVTEYHLRLSRALRPDEATLLRGYFGEVFADELLLHHHHADGSLHYAYPRVQFKVLDRSALLIGLADGGDLVARLWGEVERARIGAEELPILEAGLTRRREPLGETTDAIAYRFRTPWLGLNQENHRRYQAHPEPAERQALLEGVLVGNCLALARTFGHRVEARLTADAAGLRPHPTRLKGVQMLGFVGTFCINFQLPNRIGIGKSVSRGFGTVERVREGRSC